MSPEPGSFMRGASPSRSPAVRLRNAGKRFDDWVFRHIDLALPRGCTSAIVGPSGCGKTTLLQLVNAVHVLDEGDIEVLAAPVPNENVEAFRRRIGYAVQGAGLFPHMTVAENVSLLARLEGWQADAIEARRRELFALAGLGEELADRFPHQLSGGQQQRGGLCRALMLRPALLLLDEPFSAIDPITRSDIHREFEQLRDHSGDGDAANGEPVTTVLVTHDMREALRLADHLVVMGDGGTVVQTGAPAEVAAAPADDFVQSLLASAS